MCDAVVGRVCFAVQCLHRGAGWAMQRRRGYSDWRVAAYRSAAGNHIGGELPVQYSALTSLQFWCVAPDPT